MGGHEVDRLFGGKLGGNHEISLVFTVFGVHENDHFPLADFLDGFFYGTYHRSITKTGERARNKRKYCKKFIDFSLFSLTTI